MPQAVHKLSSSISLRRSSSCKALTSHLPMQDIQKTLFHARQLALASCIVPIRADSFSSLSIDGQASAQSPQKVQPVTEKSSHGLPAYACPSGCKLIMSCEQDATHSCPHWLHASLQYSITCWCQGGHGPNGC